MNSDVEKMALIRSYLSQVLPGFAIKEGARTGVDHTLQLFEGVTLKCTIQIGLDLLLNTRLPLSKLELALRDKDVVGWVLSSPVVTLQYVCDLSAPSPWM